MILWVDQKTMKPPPGQMVLISTYNENQHGNAGTGFLFGSWDGQAWQQNLPEGKSRPLDVDLFKVDAWATLTRPYRIDGKTMFEDALGLAAMVLGLKPAGAPAQAIRERHPEMVDAILADFKETGEL